MFKAGNQTHSTLAVTEAATSPRAREANWSCPHASTEHVAILCCSVSFRTIHITILFCFPWLTILSLALGTLSMFKGAVYTWGSLISSIHSDRLLHTTLITYSSSLGCMLWEVFQACLLVYHRLHTIHHYLLLMVVVVFCFGYN